MTTSLEKYAAEFANTAVFWIP